MENLKTPSIKTTSNIPDFFEFEESKLSQFIHFYYEWLESNGNVDFENRRLLNYKDIDYREDGYQRFDKFLRSEFLKDIPTNLKVDERLLIKNIRDFYKSKGTEESIKILFKILFNEDVDISYPGKYILRASDGKWVLEQSLLVTLLTTLQDDNVQRFLIGAKSGAVAKIKRILQYTEDMEEKTEVFISDIIGEFIEDEFVHLRDTGELFGRILENGIIINKGSYQNTDGFLSSDMKLQDNYYYQEYSYVIHSPRSSSNYQKILKNLVHPTGTMMFGDVRIQAEFDNYNVDDVVYTMFKKQLEYPIDIFQYVQFIVEASNDKIGSMNGRYIFEYVLDIFDGDSVYQGFDNNKSYRVNFEQVNAGDQDNAFADSDKGDEIEIYGAYRNYFTSIKKLLTGNSVEIVDNFPYVFDGDFLVRKKIKDTSRIETQIVYQPQNIFKMTRITDFNSYDEVKSYEIASTKNILLTDIKKNILVKTNSSRNFTGNSKPNSVLSVKHPSNGETDHYFIKGLLDEKSLYINDSYKYGKLENLDVEVHNI